MSASAADTPVSLAPDCEHWLNKFIDYLRYERGLSDHTIKNYARQLEQIALSLELTSWQQLNQAAVKKSRRHCPQTKPRRSQHCTTLICTAHVL